MEEGQLLLRHRVNWKTKLGRQTFRYVRGRREVGQIIYTFSSKCLGWVLFFGEKQTRSEACNHSWKCGRKVL